MNFLEDLNGKTLLICENNIKKKILRYLSEKKILADIKFMSKKELIDQFFFKTDSSALYYLIDNYGYKVDVAKMYLNNLKFINEDKYSDIKLQYLSDLKKELDANNLLIRDNLFCEYLKSVSILFYGYSYFTQFESRMIDELRGITKVDIINLPEACYKHDVLEFQTITEEVEYVLIQICELLSNHVDINHIKLANVSNDYNFILKKMFGLYNIPIHGLAQVSLYATKIGQEFLKNLDGSLDSSLNLLKENKKYDHDVINKIVDICNKYVEFKDLKIVKKLIEEDFKKVLVDEVRYDKAVEIIDLKEACDEDYVFMLNFNQGSVPKLKKDEDYISDNLCSIVGLDSSYMINKLEKMAIIGDINRVKNLVITYKLHDSKSTYYPSNLIKEMNLIVIKPLKKYDTIYSKKYKSLELADMLDNYFKYGVSDDNLGLLYNNIELSNYQTYNNQFNGIDKEYFYNNINKQLTLSYTSMNSYNECAFKYYVSKVLKVDPYQETFFTIVGTIFHHVLEIGLFRDIDVKEEVKEFVGDKEFSAKEQFFLDKLIDELIFVLDVVKKQTEQIGLDKYLFEEEVVITKGKNLSVTFKGFVDKIIYSDTVQKVVALIDYKTGNADIDLKLAPYGLKMQLPVYLYLVNNKLKDVKFAGFYLQKIVNNEVTISDKSEYEQKVNNLKLQGYSTDNISVLSRFDKGYENSNLISGLKVKANGEFYSTAKVLSDEKIDNLIKLTEEKIDECIGSIEDANFDINPKLIGNGPNMFSACTFCKFKDICFKTDKDYVRLEEIKDLSFLGGEDNA